MIKVGSSVEEFAKQKPRLKKNETLRAEESAVTVRRRNQFVSKREEILCLQKRRLVGTPLNPTCSLAAGTAPLVTPFTEPSPEEEGVEEEVEAVEETREAGLEEMETRRAGIRVHAGEITILRPRGMGWRTGDRIAKCG